LSGKDVVIDTFTIRLETTTKLSGRISAQVIGWEGSQRKIVENVKIKEYEPTIQFKSDENFIGLSGITVMIHMIGGDGDTAWEHTQLFRTDRSTKLAEIQHPFIMDMKLKPRNDNKDNDT